MENECWVDTGGHSLWKTALEFSNVNQNAVYQSIYALFVSNKGFFNDEDIHQLRHRTLRCPDNNAMDMIDAAHAKQLFQDSINFKNENP